MEDKKICFVSLDLEDGGEEKLEKILNLFQKFEASATLFVTGRLLERYSQLIKKWANFYEIASHSYTHRFWNTLSLEEKERELENFIDLYQKIFGKKPRGFRAPSHLIDEEGLKLLIEKGFFYDSSVVSHYPFFKKYRGYQGKAPLLPYWPSSQNIRQALTDSLSQSERRILEIPLRGQILGIPLVGAWITKLPFWFYKILFFIYSPPFLTLSWHSWDSLKNLDKILFLLKKKNYQFLNGEEIYQNYQ